MNRKAKLLAEELKGYNIAVTDVTYGNRCDERLRLRKNNQN